MIYLLLLLFTTFRCFIVSGEFKHVGLYKENLLKSTAVIGGCNYSIGLFDSFGDGWNGNTATVRVNNVVVLDKITLTTGKGPVWFNFALQPNYSIVVTFNPTGNYLYETSYKVYSEPQGGGYLVYFGKSASNGPASPVSIINFCGLELPTAVSFIAPANFTVLGAGSSAPISLISPPIASDFTVQLACNSAQVTTTYVITSNINSNQLIPSNFYGDACIFSVIAPLNLFTISNTVNVTIKTQLSFVSPTIGQNITSSSAIPIFVSPGFTLTPIEITAIIQCGNVFTNPFKFFTSTPFNFTNYTSEFYGDCILNVIDAPDNFLKPQAVNFRIKFSLVFINTPSTIYIGENFTTTVNTTVPIIQASPLPAINLDLFCASTLIQSWQNVSINRINVLALTAPNTAVQYACTYSIGLFDSFGDGWNGNTATVRVNNVVVLDKITLTTGKGPVWFNFALQPNYSIVVTFNPTGNYLYETSYKVYSEPQGGGDLLYFGAPASNGPASPASILNNCKLPFFLKTPRYSLFYNQASNIVNKVVKFSSPTNFTVLGAGSSVPISLISSPIIYNFVVQLACNNIQVTTYAITSYNNSNQLIPSNFYGDACIFSVIAPLNLFTTTNTVTITITQQLSFASPVIGQNITSSSAIPILVSTGLAVVTTEITAIIQCGNVFTDPFKFFTSTPFNFTNYTSEFYGNCILSVTNSPVYFSKPQAVNFSIRFDLICVNAPTIYVGQIFTIEIKTSVPVIQSTPPLPFIDLNLFCAGILYESWFNLPINQVNTLTLTADVTQQFNCYLMTPLRPPIYNQQITPVNVQYLISPFGSPLKYISPDQLEKILKSFASANF